MIQMTHWLGGPMTQFYVCYWPRKYTTRVDRPIPTRFEVDMTIHCRVIEFLSANTSHDLVTLTFDLLTLNSWHTWRVTCPTLPPSLKTLRLSVLELRVKMFPVGYHWERVRGHCAWLRRSTKNMTLTVRACNCYRFLLLYNFISPETGRQQEWEKRTLK